MNKFFQVCFFALTLALVSRAKVLRGPVDIRADTVLTVEGKKFYYGPDQVYLSGTNPAWINYGYDFGNNQWETTTGVLWTEEVQEIAAAGGNSIRVWVHVEGYNTPEFDSSGYVVSTDAADTLVSDLRAFLDVCQENGVFLNMVLWNGAVMSNENYKNLVLDEEKLQSYINNALTTMVLGLSDHPALMAWEIINEPEGLVMAGTPDNEPCYDTVHLTWTDSIVNNRSSSFRAPGWAENLPMENVLKFINWQADRIRTLNQNALVTTGSWSPYASCDAEFFNEDPVNKYAFNHYKDECLTLAGGKAAGIMDFWQFHSYPYNGEWISGAPWLGSSVDDYEYDAPLVIGEFPCADSGANDGYDIPGGSTTAELTTYLYENDFDGGWTWFYGSDNTEEQDADVLTGMEALQGRTDHGVIEVTIQ